MALRVNLPTIGSRVSVLRSIDLHPHAIILAGSYGIIVRSDPEFVDILMLSALYRELVDNIAWLCPLYDNVWEYITMHTQVALCA